MIPLHIQCGMMSTIGSSLEDDFGAKNLNSNYNDLKSLD
jgi:hypothetical protein